MRITIETGDTFADRLKFTRRIADISQAELSKRTGIAAATLSSYESTENPKSPPVDKAILIAKALNVSIDWLCGISGETPEWMEGNNYDDE